MKKLKTMKQKTSIVSNPYNMDYNTWINYIYEQIKLIKLKNAQK